LMTDMIYPITAQLILTMEHLMISENWLLNPTKEVSG